MRLHLSLLAAAVLLLVQPAQATPQPPPAPPWESRLDAGHELVGRIWSPPEGRFLAFEELAERLQRADILLLGEKHDNPDHHRLQAWALETSAALGRKPAVAFEMVDASRGAVLRGYAGDAAGLGPALDWDKSGWPAWATYQPIAEVALRAGAPMLPANLTAEQVRGLARSGGSPPVGLDPRLDLAGPFDPKAAEALAEDIRQGHCNMLPDRAIPGMVLVQRARDATMAAALADALAIEGRDQAVLVAGWGHVRKDVAVPVHLTRLLPDKRVFALAVMEVGQGRPAAEQATADLPFDAVWFTPRLDDEDPCAMMAEQMKKVQDRRAKEKAAP